jgi:hypothetical protein
MASLEVTGRTLRSFPGLREVKTMDEPRNKTKELRLRHHKAAKPMTPPDIFEALLRKGSFDP